METLGQTIRRLREAKGWTRRTLSQEIDRVEAMIARWEYDQARPDGVSLARLTDALGSEVMSVFLTEELDSPTTVRISTKR